MSEISAEIIINQLRNDQPVIYDHAEIVGDLKLDSLTDGIELGRVMKSVNATINITNSIFRGNIYSDLVLFKKPFIIERSVIEGDAFFQNAFFLDISKLDSTTFQRRAYFDQANFYKDAIFKTSSFKKESNFNGSIFNNEANFDGSTFNDAYFTNCHFIGYSRFGKAVFEESSYFEGSSFLDNASFNKAQFLGKAFLGSAKFNGKTYFTDSNFRDSASFSGSNFKDVYFNGADLANDVAFLNSSFNGKASFIGARFQKDAIFYRANFSSDVNLLRCDYNKLVLHWNIIRDHIKPDETIYRRLIENYKNLYWISDVNECYFDYRNWKQSTKIWTDITKIPDIFLELYCGYGTRPLNTLLWICSFIIIFGLYYWRKGGVRQIRKPVLGEDRILLTAKRVSEDTFFIEQIPENAFAELSRFRSLLLSLKFSLYVLASKDTSCFRANEAIEPQIVELECWLGRGLFVIFMYYAGSLVISYFTPQP